MTHTFEPEGHRTLSITQILRGGAWRVESMRALSRPRLIWFTKGQGRITVSGVTRGYGANNVVFVPANTMHGFEASRLVQGTIVEFPQNAGLGFGGTLPEDPVHLRLRDVAHQGEFSTLMDRFQSELSQNLPGRQAAVAAHGALLLVWLNRMIGGAADDPLPSGSSKRIAVAYSALVERDFAAGRSVAAFAADLGVTPTHLSRACKAASGRPAHALLNDRVMAEAYLLLSETRRPIREISEALGFSSAAYFTRAFQKHTGKTPSEFRRTA
ncbi:MAG: AraC family transcriptional regulator [Pseudomonadota bacterium]